MSGETVLSAENSAKPLGGRGSASNPIGGAHGAPTDSLASGNGVASPARKTHPRSWPSALRSCYPIKKFGHALVPVRPFLQYFFPLMPPLIRAAFTRQNIVQGSKVFPPTLKPFDLTSTQFGKITRAIGRRENLGVDYTSSNKAVGASGGGVKFSTPYCTPIPVDA